MLPPLSSGLRLDDQALTTVRDTMRGVLNQAARVLEHPRGSSASADAADVTMFPVHALDARRDCSECSRRFAVCPQCCRSDTRSRSRDWIRSSTASPLFLPIAREPLRRNIDARLAAGGEVGRIGGRALRGQELCSISRASSTIAGSKILADHPPATRNAFAIDRLEAAGAILVGALNMDEFALWLHDRKRTLRRDTEPSRPGANRGRLVGRLGGSGRRWPGAADTRHRYERFGPCACSALRSVRPETHALRACREEVCIPLSIVSIMSACSHARCGTSRSPTTFCKAGTTRIRIRPIALPESSMSSVEVPL